MTGNHSDMLDMLRQKAEMALSEKTAAEDREQVDISKLFHELKIYQLELEMQVEELLNSADALEIQKNKFKHLFEEAPVAYLVTDRRGIVADINGSGLKLLGAAGKNTLVGKPFTAFINPDDIDVFYLLLRDLFSRGEKQQRVIRMINKAQKNVTVHVSGVIIKEDNHEQTCYLALTDIDELQETKSKLDSAKQRLELALDASMTGIWEVDITTGQIFLDDFCKSIFELKSFGFDNCIESLLNHIHTDDRQLFESALRRAIVSYSPFMMDFRVQSVLK